MSTLIASIPRHLYCWIDTRFIGHTPEGPGLIPASWYGLRSVPGRAWGIDVLLENGAVYANLPPHALLFEAPSEWPAEWSLADAQLWDCFGYDFAVHEYEQLAGRDVELRGGRQGVYLFTAQHYGDAYSLTPEQAKQYHFIRTDHGRLAILPGNHVLFHDKCFTTIANPPVWPKWLRRQVEVYECENAPPASAPSGPF